MNKHIALGKPVVWSETAAFFSFDGNSKASILCMTPLFASKSHFVMFATSLSLINILYSSLPTETKNNKIQLIVGF